jgi:serine/threonine protein kinase
LTLWDPSVALLNLERRRNPLRSWPEETMSSGTFKCRKIDKYDGQFIFKGNTVVYELGNYLGGGASGSVYQAFDPVTDKSVAVKILNPLGYKNSIVGQIGKCPVAVKGQPLSGEQIHGKARMHLENVWWLLAPSGQPFAAYEDPHRCQLRELPLPRCLEIWGPNPLAVEQRPEGEVDKLNLVAQGSRVVTLEGRESLVPAVSPKYLRFLRSRQSVCRYI